MSQRLFKSLEDFELLNKSNRLGKGSFATVHKLKCKHDQQYYAIELDQGRSLKQQIETIKTEIEIHKNLHHKNIVKLYDYFLQDGSIYLVMEYASNGNLFIFIRKKRIQMQKIYKKIFKQTCEALQYIHSKGIIHRDLKPENILLDDEYNIKVCDFGWSAFTLQKRTTFCGTYEYMAPEIFEGQRYNNKVDSWSLGILLYELLHQYSPFRASSSNMVYQNIKRQTIVFETNVNQESKNLIKKILQIDPNQRPTVNEILQSKFFLEEEKENMNHNILRPRSIIKKFGMKKKTSPVIEYMEKIKEQSILSKKSKNSQKSKRENWSFLRKPQTTKKASFTERSKFSQKKQYYKKSFLQSNKIVKKDCQWSMSSAKEKKNSITKLQTTNSLNQICQALKKSFSQRKINSQKMAKKNNLLNFDPFKTKQNSLKAKSPFKKYLLKAKLQNKFVTLQKQQTVNSPYYVF